VVLRIFSVELLTRRVQRTIRWCERRSIVKTISHIALNCLHIGMKLKNTVSKQFWNGFETALLQPKQKRSGRHVSVGVSIKNLR